MKNLILVTLILISYSTTAQTKLIAHKSHSGTSENFSAENYPDNFGLREPYFPVYKVKLLPNNCVVEYREQKRNDTICDHPYYSGRYTLDQIKTFYPENIEFIGFEKKFFNDSIPVPTKPIKNEFYLFVFFFLSGSGFLFMYKKARI